MKFLFCGPDTSAPHPLTKQMKAGGEAGEFNAVFCDPIQKP